MSIRTEYIGEPTNVIVYYGYLSDITNLKENIQNILGTDWTELNEDKQWLPTFRYIPNNGRGISLPTKRNWCRYTVEQGYTTPVTPELKRKLNEYLSENNDFKFEQYIVGGYGYVIKIIPKHKK